MEAAVLSASIKVALTNLLSVGFDEYKLRKGAKRDIEYLKWELLMIVGAIDDEESIQGEHLHQISQVRTRLMEQLRFLAYSIEDCMDLVRYLDIWKQHSSWLSRSMNFSKTMPDDRSIATKARRLRELTKEAHECVQKYINFGSKQALSCVAHKDEESSDDPPSRLVGIDEPMSHLLEHLAESKGGAANKKLKVIAIVGFFGMGKTALAAEVYKRQVRTGSSFRKHAWVSAADKQPSEVLNQLLHQFNGGAGSSKATSLPEDLPDLRNSCAEHLKKRRYLIVIDDIRTEDLWKNIGSAFPVNNGTSSRVVITTTSQQVANVCTSSGYVLKMSRLDEESSKELFCMEASGSKETPQSKEFLSYISNHPDSDTVSKRCRGQPFALVTAAKFMLKHGWPRDSGGKNLCGKLNHHLQEDESFKEMRQALNRSYTSLGCHARKSCLLYLAMFPSDCQIRRKSLLRRWLAEGFMELHSDRKIPDPSIAFDDLVDRSIIEPSCFSNNQTVKACRTYGLMHEFLLHMSTSQKFATLLCGEMTEHKDARRLSVHKNTAKDDYNLETEVLSLVRSLLIFGEASDTILDFSKYLLLRVLDLEKCDNLKNGDHGPSKEGKKHDPLKKICHLLLLKYLSLGENIKILPKHITNLRVLQTLDLRGSGVNTLPQKVLRMPGLIHLFGKFKLPDKLKGKSHDFLQKNESKLQTLAGFIADGRKDYLNIMGCMEKLKKVKVWCEPSEGADNTTNWTNLRDAIEQFIHVEREVKTGDRSLSLHFSECFGDSINSLTGSGYLSSLKLHGKLHVLPQFVSSLRGLKELCVGLESAKLEKGLLEALTKLESLQYLKLIAKDLDMFVIKHGAFPSLLCLCFVQECPTFPRIQKGSMPHLVTLQLLCKGMDGLCGIEMEDLTTELKEIILDHGVNAEIKKKWEKAAKEHPNKPKVYLSETTGNEESGDHDVNLEVSRTESPENYLDVVPQQSINGTIDHGVAPEESASITSVQQSSHSDDFSQICSRLLSVPLPPFIRSLCFMGLVMCVLVGVLAVGWL